MAVGSMGDGERRLLLAEEFHRALKGDPAEFPWGLTPAAVLALRPTQDDIELWLLAVRYPDIRNTGQLTRGRKGHFTRRFQKIWNACANSYSNLDRTGAPGYYEIWTSGNINYSDPQELGCIWARSMPHAQQVSALLFDHVAGPNKYSPSGRGDIRIRFLGGSIGEDETRARRRHSASLHQQLEALAVARAASQQLTDRVELLEARVAAVLSIELMPGDIADE